MIYRLEHPNPQWERETWRNLNGKWEFDFDFGKSARDRELYKKNEKLSMEINVPFCPESKLSGIEYRDFIPGVCYRKVIELTEDEVSNKVFLHFGAVDYKCFIYVNGKEAGKHIGGYSSFSFDITEYVNIGENTIFVIAEDDPRSGEQPIGKQSRLYYSHDCDYSRTTGIWQTVWLEFVPRQYIEKCKYFPDIDNAIVTIQGKVCGCGQLTAKAFFEGKNVGKNSITVNDGDFVMQIALSELHLWEVGKGALYDLELSFGDDKVKSYFGMRTARLKGKYFELNGKKVFHRTVLDQGFYPDGIYTAQSDEELKRDIEISMAAGFNGARLHQKVFEKRFLYHCDKVGYIVWGEHANWGMDYRNPIAVENFICEWTEIIERDFNNPSIIGWCPFNETWEYWEFREKHRVIESVYKVTKQIDDTRPCIAVSGHYHIGNMEIHDVHDYRATAEEFKENYAHIEDKGIVNDGIRRAEGDIQPYKKGTPVFISEYGGFKCVEENDDGWGYGESIRTKDDFIDTYDKFTTSMIDNPSIMGFCYTQLYDVEQEQNGLYTFDRKPKFDMKKIKEINSKTAKCELIDGE